MPILYGYRLASHVDGTAPIPPREIDGVLNPAFSNWFCDDQIVRSWINGSVSESIFTQIARCQTAKEAWDKLSGIYSKGAQTQIQQLRKQLRQLMRGTDTIDDYMRKARTIADQLAAFGCPVEDGVLVCDVLAGLGTEYRPFTRAIEARIHPASFDELYALLLSEEQQLRFDSLSLASSVPPTAQYGAAGRGNSGGGRPRGRGRGRGGSSGRHGYYNNGGRGNSSSDTVICYNCNGNGHLSRQCPSPRSVPQANAARIDGGNSAGWTVDSGANYHLVANQENIHHPQPVTDNTALTIADGKTLPLHSVGSSVTSINGRDFTLNNVLYSPAIKNNLLSVSAFTAQNNTSLEFFPDYYFVKDIPTRQVLYQGRSKDGLYFFPMQSVRSFSPKAFSASISLWHNRLGHANVKVVKNVLRANKIAFDSNSSFDYCHSCSVSKSHKLPFSNSNHNVTKPLELICSDVWGPSPVVSVDGFRYYVLFFDHFSKYCWVYFMKQKSDVFSIFVHFKNLVERYFGLKIKSFQSDWGGEYQSLHKYLLANGITHRVSCPHTPEQNGCAERKHRHIVELGRALLNQASVPFSYWSYAFDSVVYTINRLPSSHTNKTPFEVLFKDKPNYDELRVFGSLCYPWLKPYAPHKLAPRSSRCVFLGYSKLHKGYICLELATTRKFISRHVLFYEQVFPFQDSDDISTSHVNQPTSIPLPPVPLSQSNIGGPGLLGRFPTSIQSGQQFSPSHVVHSSSTTDLSSSPNIGSPTVPELSSDQHTGSIFTESLESLSRLPSDNQIVAMPLSPISPVHSDDNDPILPLPQQERRMVTRSQTGNLKPRLPWSPTTRHAQILPATPTCYTKAISNPLWREAMVQELNALIQTQTWVLVPRGCAQNIVGCKWVFRIKQKADGSIDRYKARLVAKGFHQRPGIDYFETFSPVIKPTTIRIILSLAVSRGWNIRQLDVSNAFLHGNLDDVVYMEQPPGFKDPSKPDFVCCLQRSLYGLRQAPRQWYKRLAAAFQKYNFRVSTADSSLFCYNHGDVVIFALAYVDDIILTGSNLKVMRRIIESLQTEFLLKDLGNLDYFLGMEATWMDSGLLLTQQKYVLDLLHKANMATCKGISTPTSTKDKMVACSGRLFSDPTLYRSIVGGLQYLSLTRPEMCYSIHKVSQFMHAPTEDNWSSVKRILRYLKATSHYGVFISPSLSSSLNIYTDADWGSDLDDRKSTSGFAIFFGKNLISWNSKKQRTVAKSSTEAEYRALGLAVLEYTWIESLLRDIGCVVKHPANLWCDNIGATYLSVNPVFHARSKHLEVDYHFVRDKVTKNEIKVQFLSSKDQLADILTKPLSKARHYTLLQHLTIRPSVTPRQLELQGPDKDTQDTN